MIMTQAKVDVNTTIGKNLVLETIRYVARGPSLVATILIIIPSSADKYGRGVLSDICLQIEVLIRKCVSFWRCILGNESVLEDLVRVSGVPADQPFSSCRNRVSTKVRHSIRPPFNRAGIVNSVKAIDYPLKVSGEPS
jgi:hypothetical protein